MKQTLQKLLIAIAGLLVSTNAFAYDFVVGGIYYTKLSDGFSVEVSKKTSGYTTSGYTGDIVIPEKVSYDGLSYNVISIGNKAFYKSSVTSVILPQTIINIDNQCFEGCRTLQNINIPSNITNLGSSAFKNCIALKEISIPRGISTLYLGTFYGCESITKIIIPNNVMQICYSSATYVSGGSIGYTQGLPCFADCSSLKEIIFEDGDRPLTFIDMWNGSPSNGTLYENEIFYGCPIEYVYIGRTFSESIFESMTTLKNIKFGSLVYSIPEYAFYECSNLESVNISSNILSLGTSCFSGCTNLSQAIIGNGITSLENSCFNSCSKLQNVYIGNSLNSIKNAVFNGCTSLTNIYLFSDALTTLETNAIPTTVSRIYVPNTERYENLLSGYYTDNLLTIYESETEYTGKVPELSYKNNVEGMSVSFDAETTPIDAGKYSTKIKAVFSNDNWSTSINAPCTYTITKAPITVIANDAKRQYGDDNPEFSCSYFGFKNNENEEVLISKPTIATTATKESGVGTYPIIATGAEAQNYSFSYERGTLTITQATQSIEWEQTFDNLFVGDQLELTAVATSGLAIKYSVSDESIAEIYTSNGSVFLDCLKAGEVTIKANQAGDDNYASADRVTKKIIISETSGIENINNDSSINVTSKGNNIIIKGIKNTPVEVYNINGQLVYTGNDTTISVADKGIYIVKVADKTFKVAL